MHDARHRRAAAVAHVRRRPRDGAGRGDPAEDRGGEVRHALGHQLHVGAVATADHPVGHNRREERLNRAEERDRERRLHELPGRVPGHLRNPRCRKPAADLPEAGTDRLDVEMEDLHGRGRGNQGDERTGDAAVDPGPELNDQDRPDADAQGPEVHRVQMPGVAAPLLHEVGRHGGHAKPEEILDLAGENHDADPGGETGGDRVRDELDRAAQSRQAKADEHHAGHQGGDRETVDPVALDDPVDDHDEGAGRAADLYPGAAER